MMHKGHSSTGYAVSTVVIAGYDVAEHFISGGHVNPAGHVIGAVFGAGMALFCDGDHDKSAFTKSMGPVTRGVAETLQSFARHTYAATRMRHDPKPEAHSGEHRGLMHTWPAAVVTGALIGALSYLVPYAGSVALLLGLTPALRSLAWCVPDWIVLVVNNMYRALRGRKPRSKPWFFLRGRPGALLAAIVITAAVTQAGTVQVVPPALMGFLATIGMLVHDGGDTLTKQGIPWGWPFAKTCKRCREAGRRTKCARWVRVSLPARLTIELGGTAENVIKWLSMAAGTAILIAGTL